MSQSPTDLREQSSSFITSERSRRGATAVFAALFLLLTAYMVAKYLHRDLKDAEVWYDAGRRALTGRPLVGLAHYRYPPAFAVMIAPLCLLPEPAFFFLWYLLGVALFLVSVYLAARLVTPSAAWRDLPGYRLSALLVAVLAIDNVVLGQTNLLVMALVYWTFLEVERGREWLAGLPLAAAIAVKVFPAPLLLYFLYRRRWRAAVSAAACCVILFLLLPAPLRGFRHNYQEAFAWGARVVMPYLERGRAGDWGQHALDFGNQSLQAVAHRLLRPVDAGVQARRRPAPLLVNVAGLSEDRVNHAVLALFALLGGSFLVACGWSGPRSSLEQAVEYSMATILLLLVSALAWTYFFVMLLLPVTTALALLRASAVGRSTRAWLLAGLWGLGVATLLLVSAHARALGCLFWAALIAYVGLARARWELRRSALARP